jgi:hypothetical protein
VACAQPAPRGVTGVIGMHMRGLRETENPRWVEVEEAARLMPLFLPLSVARGRGTLARGRGRRPFSSRRLHMLDSWHTTGCAGNSSASESWHTTGCASNSSASVSSRDHSRLAHTRTHTSIMVQLYNRLNPTLPPVSVSLV